MKSLSVNPLSIVFGKQDVGNKRTRKIIIENTGNENCEVSEVTTKGAFGCNLEGKVLPPPFPASSTIYFRENYTLQDENGAFATENQGYGIVGTTDENGLLTVDISKPKIEVESPDYDANFELGAELLVVWNSTNVEYVDIILESETGYKKIENIDAEDESCLTSLEVSDGFLPNQDITITVMDVTGIASDSTVTKSIATLTIDAIGEMVEGEKKEITGTTNGTHVTIFKKLHTDPTYGSVGTADVDVEAGTWSYDLTIGTAGSWDIMAQDSDNGAGFAVQENVTVASAEFSGTYEFCAQKVSSGDADKAVYIVSTEVHGDYIYVEGYTTGAKLLGSLTNLATVGGTNIGFLAKFNKKMELQWVSFIPNIGGGVYRTYPASSAWIYYDESYSYIVKCVNASRHLSLCKIDMSDGSIVSTRDMTTAGKIVYDLLGKPTIHDSKIKLISKGSDGAGCLALVELPLDLSSYDFYNKGAAVSTGSGIFTDTYCYATGSAGATGYEILLSTRAVTTRSLPYYPHLDTGIVVSGITYSPGGGAGYYEIDNIQKWTTGGTTFVNSDITPNLCFAVRYADSKILVCYKDDGNNDVVIKQMTTSLILSNYKTITPNTGSAYPVDVCDYGDNLLIAGAVKAGGKMNATFTDECPSVAHAFIHIQAKED